MQDDRSLTFRQIHGDKEALLSAVEDIERIALVPSYEIGPLRLRFLEPHPQGGTEFDYILTPVREIRLADVNNYDYITVSYVWTHSQPIDGIKLPEYRVWDGRDLQKHPRILRCPPIVFHRVVQFTKAEKLERIWIDQECIDQTDSNDVEKHLQDMHRIYRFSAFTVAILSKVSGSWTFSRDYYLGDSLSDDEMQTTEETLRKMVEDPWFTRSWTFHEQYCAANIVYLLPRPPLRHYTLSSPPGFMESSISTLEKDFVLHGTRPMLFLNLCEYMKRDNSALKSVFLRHGHDGLLSGNIPDAIETVQKKIEKRKNQILSDRIQIIANVCGLGWKLETTSLNTPAQSYSTCLLALAMANRWSDPAERAYQYQAFGDAFMRGGIEGALRELRSAQQHLFLAPAWISPRFRRDFVDPLCEFVATVPIAVDEVGVYKH